jgi:hypothetical protein
MQHLTLTRIQSPPPSPTTLSSSTLLTRGPIRPQDPRWTYRHVGAVVLAVVTRVPRNVGDSGRCCAARLGLRCSLGHNTRSGRCTLSWLDKLTTNNIRPNSSRTGVPHDTDVNYYFLIRDCASSLLMPLGGSKGEKKNWLSGKVTEESSRGRARQFFLPWDRRKGSVYFLGVDLPFLRVFELNRYAFCTDTSFLLCGPVSSVPPPRNIYK